MIGTWLALLALAVQLLNLVFAPSMTWFLICATVFTAVLAGLCLGFDVVTIRLKRDRHG